MPTCPNGHQSVAEDWCEVCGYRMPAPSAAVPPPPPPPPGMHGPEAGGIPQGELCPQCRTPREAQAPFCEECRYNFLTNSPTTYIPPVPSGPAPEQAPYQKPPYPQPYAPQQPAPPQPQSPQYSGDWVIPPPSPPAPRQQPPHQQYQQPGAGPEPAHPGVPGGPGGGWMVAVGPDRQYFEAMMRRSGPEAAQLSLPAYAPEQQFPLSGQQVTIGRRRQSTGEAPGIDLSRPPEDPGVSHQHAVLVQQPDGSWAVVDQDSTNGTTVNGAEEPIQPYVPVQLAEGDRIHVGAWTTLTVYRTG